MENIVSNRINPLRFFIPLPYTGDMMPFTVGDYARFYRSRNIADYYPEIRTVPAYLCARFPVAKTVLDLGFGGGLWFWASFLPSLTRLDGMDRDPEAHVLANNVNPGTPAGFALAHSTANLPCSEQKLSGLYKNKGILSRCDYRSDWPPAIADTKYDLVTEHGGGFGDMSDPSELQRVLERVSRVLKPDGAFFFMNFTENDALVRSAIVAAGMRVADFRRVRHTESKLGIRSYYFGVAVR